MDQKVAPDICHVTVRKLEDTQHIRIISKEWGEQNTDETVNIASLNTKNLVDDAWKDNLCKFENNYEQEEVVLRSAQRLVMNNDNNKFWVTLYNIKMSLIHPLIDSWKGF